MKLSIQFFYAIITYIVIGITAAHAQAPQITNVSFAQRTDGTFKVDIYYDLYNVQGTTMIIAMKVSSDNGLTWDFSCPSKTGDLGNWVSNGTNKHIIWDFAADHPYTFNDKFRVKIIADGGGIPCPGLPTVTYGGKTYNTVQIATQCWLVQNLDIGEMILGSQTPSNNGVIEKYCYSNDISNCNNYGGLYQWNEAMQYVTTQGVKGICPNGWHIPTNAELQTLSIAVGGDGNSLKAGGQGSGSGTGTNTTGYSALLAGYRSGDNFLSLELTTSFWSSTEYSSTGVYDMALYSPNSTILIDPNDGNKAYGYSVRCLRN